MEQPFIAVFKNVAVIGSSYTYVTDSFFLLIVAYACVIFCHFYVIRKVLHVFKLCNGGLNQTKV